MQLKRTLINIKFPVSKTKRVWASAWAEWWNSGGFEWINHVGAPQRKKADYEKERQTFLKAVLEMRDQVYSPETLKYFKKVKYLPNNSFTVENVMMLAIEKDSPFEEVALSGYGDPTHLVELLKSNNYEFTLRNTY